MSYQQKSATQEEFEADIATNITTLRNNLEILHPKSKDFARKLCDWYSKYDSLSEKQLYYAAKFWAEANEAGASQHEPSRGRTVPRNEDSTLVSKDPAINGMPLLDRFHQASSSLKWPSIIYKLDGDRNLKFALCGDRSRYPRGIKISDGRRYQEERVYGYILTNGEVLFDGGITLAKKLILKDVIENYLERMVVNGKKFTFCCFCGTELTSKESLFTGYGPICAINWGLPWGEVEEVKDLGLGDL